MQNAVVIEAVGSPIARAHPEKGNCRDVRADGLSADIMRALLDRVPFPPNQVEDIQWGCVKQEKEQGYNVARMASLIAGFPVEVPATTVNRLCGSSLQALNQAAQALQAAAPDVPSARAAEHTPPRPSRRGRWTYRSPVAWSTCTTSRWRQVSTRACATSITTASPRNTWA